MRKSFDWDINQTLEREINNIAEQETAREKSFFKTRNQTLTIEHGIFHTDFIVDLCNYKNPPFVRILFKVNEQKDDNTLWQAIAEKVLEHNNLSSIQIMYESCDGQTGHIREERWWKLIKSEDGTITRSNIW